MPREGMLVIVCRMLVEVRVAKESDKDNEAFDDYMDENYEDIVQAVKDAVAPVKAKLESGTLTGYYVEVEAV